MSSYLSEVNYRAVGATLLPYAGAFVGSRITSKGINSGWYDSLKKPSWGPPKWAFGPVWTTLYGSMGYASYLVYRDGGGFGGPAKIPLALYGTQLALNWAWTPIFFYAKKLKWATYEIGASWLAIAATGLTFYQINRTAGLLFLPYQAWVTLASVLTYKIWRDNGDDAENALPVKQD